jgi:Arc/MetJ family transcription regulator
MHRTNIVIDDDLVCRLRRATGLATTREIVDSALRFYLAALQDDDFVPTRKLGDALRAEQRAQDEELSPSQRVEEALALGEELFEKMARAQGITYEEAVERYEAVQAGSRRARRGELA